LLATAPVLLEAGVALVAAVLLCSVWALFAIDEFVFDDACGFVAAVALLVALDVDAVPPLSLMLEETFVTPCVLSARAIAWLTWVAFSAVPESVTSPFCELASICAFALSESAAIFCFTVLVMAASSTLLVVELVVFVRTIVLPLCKSDWIDDGSKLNCVICVEMSMFAPELDGEKLLLDWPCICAWFCDIELCDIEDWVFDAGALKF
jgi:hypothetical protein